MIKASAVLERVKELAETFPDTVRACTYFKDDGTPCCIVGQALFDLGVDPQPFMEDESLNEATSVRSLFRVYDTELGLADDLPQEEEGMHLLSLIQIGQDQGLAWGEALERASGSTSE